MQLYSAALICVGVSYKLLLLSYTYPSLTYTDDATDKVTTRLLGETSSTAPNLQSVGNLFSGSLAIAFICLDIIILSHKGLKQNIDRSRCPDTHNILLGVMVVVVGTRLGLAAFIATLSVYATDPMKLSVIGIAAIFLQILFRSMGDFLVKAQQDHIDELHAALTHTEATKTQDLNVNDWPNVTQAQCIARGLSLKEDIKHDDEESNGSPNVTESNSISE